MPTNNRVFWAVEKVAIKRNSAPDTNQSANWNAKAFPSGALSLHLNSDYVLSGVDEVGGRWEIVRGAQSIASTTTFNLEQVFELGQIEVYEDSERVPDIEVTLEKVIDGTKPIYIMAADPAAATASDGAPDVTLNTRIGSYRSDIALVLYPDTQQRATGTARSSMVASGMYMGSITYTFPVDGPVTESITFVGNDKLWANYNPDVTGQAVTSFPTAGQDGIPGSGYSIPTSGFALAEATQGTASSSLRIIGSGIQRREDVDMRRSVLPSDIPGITGVTLTTTNASNVGGSASGVVLQTTGNMAGLAERVQTVTLSVDLNRQDLNELGSKRPFTKFIQFPVETTAAIEVITSQGDMVEANAAVDIGSDNTQANQTIIMRTIDGLQVDLGDGMRLQSIDIGGGDAGGDNMTVTYNYRGFNTFNITHDSFYPYHRVYVSAAANSRFNVGAASSY